jgi:hypothetical protein
VAAVGYNRQPESQFTVNVRQAKEHLHVRLHGSEPYLRQPGKASWTAADASAVRAAAWSGDQGLSQAISYSRRYHCRQDPAHC